MTPPTTTDTEQRILDQIQSDFPLTGSPWARLAETIGCSPAHVHETVRELKKKQIIRRIGASYIPSRLGHITTLAAAEVCNTQLEKVAHHINRFNGVTHNYERNSRLNLWFTVIAPTAQDAQSLLSKTAAVPGVKNLHSIPALKTFKLRVHFPFSSFSAPSRPLQKTDTPAFQSTPHLSTTDKLLINRTCKDIGEGMTPFREIASELGLSEEETLKRLNYYREIGLMRRFGAILHHRNAGFTANGMIVWNVPEKRINEVGNFLSNRSDVTHCYLRQRIPDWPYNLYTMLHDKDRKTVETSVNKLGNKLGISDFQILFSCREFKKTSMTYFSEAANCHQYPIV